jgi:probable F420-dependent oxidoreductase
MDIAPLTERGPAAHAYEPLTLLSFAAAWTERIDLGVMTLIMPKRHPLVLAKEIAALDRLSGGRFRLGLGVGADSDVAPFMKPSTRGRYTDEAIAVMQALWTEERVDWEGPRFEVQGAVVKPKPVQQPFPIWIGGLTERGLQRAARHDGWIGAGVSSIEEHRQLIERIHEILDEQGRDPASFQLGKRVYLAIDRPRREVERWFEAVYGTSEFPMPGAILGDTDALLEELHGLREVGTELLILNPVGAELEQFELLAGEVLPKLR